MPISNIVWLNQTGGSLKNLPGADKWIIGNYLKMFSLFRTNYDSKNWLMLTEQLLFNYKVSFDERRVAVIKGYV